MKFSIVIPQIFYDVIARVLPGLLFIIILYLAFPNEMIMKLEFIKSGQGNNFIDSLGKGILLIIISYFLGWIFSSLIYLPYEEDIRKKKEKENEKSLKEKYQWIRLSHPAAGFRIVKLRAEARMLETSRTTVTFASVVVIIYELYSNKFEICILNNISWVRIIIILLTAILICFSFYYREKKAWENYWGNIQTIYKLLHDKTDLIKKFDY
jgi:hypothetical protein